MAIDGPNIARFFCKHLVGICLALRERNDNRTEYSDFTSAFVMKVEGRWLLVTAGHCLRRLEDLHNSGNYEITACGLYDGWTPRGPSDPIPFRYTDSVRDYVDDEELGLDIGFIELPPLLARTLSAGGVEPLGPEHWATADEGFVGYVVLGQPTELYQVIRRGENVVDARVDPVLISLTKCEPPANMIKPAARFYGQLAPQTRFSDGGALNDIDGMSGGPIFGLRQHASGKLTYSLIAVQGSWNRSHRVVAGARAWWLAASLMAALESRPSLGGALSGALAQQQGQVQGE